MSSVKELARYIDAHIGNLPRGDEKPPLGPVSLTKIQNTLAMAGVRKVRGRKPKNGRLTSATFPPKSDRVILV